MGSSLYRNPAGQRVVKHGNFIKLTVAAEMIEVRVRVDNDHRFVSYLRYCLPQVPNSTTGVDQGRLFRSDNQTDRGVLVVTSFAESKKVAGNLIDLEPILGDGNLPQIGTLRLASGYIPILCHRIDHCNSGCFITNRGNRRQLTSAWLTNRPTTPTDVD